MRIHRKPNPHSSSEQAVHFPAPRVSKDEKRTKPGTKRGGLDPAEVVMSLVLFRRPFGRRYGFVDLTRAKERECEGEMKVC